jgi:tRNA threonylcarbamoyladenosine biosynthesis protein TsaE
MTGALAVASDSPDATRRLGEAIGAAAAPGDVILLSGELGAGKTLFVQGIARGLAYEGNVSSKSFVLMGEYHGRITLYHADLYRLVTPEEVEDLALAEITADGVLAVEWPERGGWAVPDADLEVAFEVLSPDQRLLHLSPKSSRGEILAAAVAEGA